MPTEVPDKTLAQQQNAELQQLCTDVATQIVGQLQQLGIHARVTKLKTSARVDAKYSRDGHVFQFSFFLQ